MAFNGNTIWEVRTTGSDSNGGGYQAGATGTDYSQQNSPQVVYTDLVIGATTTQITSFLNPFGATAVGNVINIVSGTGFVVQRVQIVSVAGVIATCDKTCGTAASTGGAGNLGGALATPAVAIPLLTGGNTVYIKAGTYNQTALITFPSVTSAPLFVVGYNATRDDNGTAPVLNMTTNSTVLLTLAGASAVISILNVSFTSTATTKADCIHNGGSSTTVKLWNCSIVGFVNGFIGESGVVGTTPLYLSVANCAITGGSASAVAVGGSFSIVNSYISGNTGTQILSVVAGTNCSITNTVIVKGGASGVSLSGVATTLIVQGCTIADNVGTGVLYNTANWVGSGLEVRSSIFYGNGAWGINLFSSRPQQVFTSNNAYGNNTSGDHNNMAAGAGDVSLTANPFTNDSTGDYSLNSAAGGGAACKAVGYPGVFPGGTTTGFLDIGAVQSAGSTGGNFGFIA